MKCKSRPSHTDEDGISTMLIDHNMKKNNQIRWKSISKEYQRSLSNIKQMGKNDEILKDCDEKIEELLKHIKKNEIRV